jgi:hypothetical protein
MLKVIVMKTKAHMTFSGWWNTEIEKRMNLGDSKIQAALNLLDYIAESDVMNKIEWAEETE